MDRIKSYLLRVEPTWPRFARTWVLLIFCFGVFVNILVFTIFSIKVTSIFWNFAYGVPYLCYYLLARLIFLMRPTRVSFELLWGLLGAGIVISIMDISGILISSMSSNPFGGLVFFNLIYYKIYLSIAFFMIFVLLVKFLKNDTRSRLVAAGIFCIGAGLFVPVLIFQPKATLLNLLPVLVVDGICDLLWGGHSSIRASIEFWVQAIFHGFAFSAFFWITFLGSYRVLRITRTWVFTMVFLVTLFVYCYLLFLGPELIGDTP